MTDPGVWNKVSLCKQRIPFSARFPKCSVSSGNRARFQRPFCSVDCWDARLSVQRHRSAHASETVGPRGPARIDQASGKLPASFRQASGKLPGLRSPVAARPRRWAALATPGVSFPTLGSSAIELEFENDGILRP
jgi:hypothetical protein